MVYKIQPYQAISFLHWLGEPVHTDISRYFAGQGDLEDALALPDAPGAGCTAGHGRRCGNFAADMGGGKTHTSGFAFVSWEEVEDK